MLGLKWEQWELIALLLFAILITAAAAWDAGHPRQLPRRPLPYPPRPDRYPKHAHWTTQAGTRDLGHYQGRVPPSSDWDEPDYPS